MFALASPKYRYYINDEDFIAEVDALWLAFARENSATELTEPSLFSKPIWDFIADSPTRSLYKEIHAHVRLTGNPVTVPFRCDSPTLERHMQLTVFKCSDNRLLYESTLMRVVPQRRLDVLDSSQKRSRDFLTMCSFCKRSLVEPSGWLDMADIALHLRLYDRQLIPELRYTVCPECENRLYEKLRPSYQTLS